MANVSFLLVLEMTTNALRMTLMRGMNCNELDFVDFFSLLMINQTSIAHSVFVCGHLTLVSTTD